MQTINSLSPYNPFYDPLLDDNPGTGINYAPSYWCDTAGEPPENDGPVTSDLDVDVAIIGGGFTGLATAMFLAQEHGINATVLEANQVGWGCTSRNGGQGHLVWGRLSRSQWVKRWGVEMARQLHDNTLQGFEIFQQLTEHPLIDCEPYGHGNLLIAHSKAALRGLKTESRLCNEILSYKTRVLNHAEVKSDYLDDRECKGAMLEPVGIAIHPLKLAYGYSNIARSSGAKVHPSSPVLEWKQKNNIHYLHTPGGIVRARSVAIATAGYTSANLHPLTAFRNMPIMANSVVTRILTDEEIAACKLNTHLLITDTRKLRHYYRFLPDKRLQIGTRSAISGKDAQNPKNLKVVQDAIARKFPILKGIETPWFWHGWMDISHDMMPRIIQPDPSQQIFYSQGYSGNGVSFSAYASFKLAELIAGKPGQKNDLPIFTSPLPKHALQPFRRLGQHLLYSYYKHYDKFR
ncbi:MAG: FAD-binding oxidoreductase [Gammaproteobacteria bacterium]|nr:FAD-binding oxidoreductase [Gammaproteobacteria bacterium]